MYTRLAYSSSSRVNVDPLPGYETKAGGLGSFEKLYTDGGNIGDEHESDGADCAKPSLGRR